MKGGWWLSWISRTGPNIQEGLQRVLAAISSKENGWEGRRGLAKPRSRNEANISPLRDGKTRARGKTQNVPTWVFLGKP